MKKLFSLFAGMMVALTAFAQVTITRLESFASIDPSATYVLGVDGTGFHASGTSSWGVCNTTSPLMYTLTPGTTQGVFYATTTIGGTLYYLSVPTSNTFSMKTSKDSVRLGTTFSATDSAYAVANVGTTARHLRLNGASGLRSYASGTGVMAFFYKYVSASAVAVTGISFADAGTYLDPGKTFQLQPIITPADATNQSITYTSSDPTVATVSASGLVTAIKPGSTMITATTADGNKSTNFAIAVRALSGTIYNKVTSVDSLSAGDKIILIAENAQKACGAKADKYLTAVDAIIYNGQATSATAAELTLGGTAGAWTLTTASGSSVGCSGSSNELKFANSSVYNVWNITISATKAVIQSTGATTYSIQYNSSGAGRFSAYASNQSAIQIYKRTLGDNPVLTAADSLVFAQKALAADGTATDSKTLAVKAEELGTDSITAVLKNGTVFAVSPAKLTSKGGNLTISYNATAVGTYLDTLVLTGKTVAGADITAQVALKAVVVAAGGITPSGTNVTYNLLQNLSDLHSGDKVFFSTVKSDVNSVMGLYDYNVASANIRLQNATYDAQRHQVTALDTYAYTVQVTNNGYQFVGSDGKFLYMYNENKNLSSTDTDIASNKAEWTISITDDVATIKNCSNQQWLMQYNISGLFCCYQGANTSTKDIVLYASQAPAYQQKVLHPAITVSDDSIVFTSPAYDDIDKVYYDSYSLTVTGTDLTASIVPTVTGDTVFKAYTTLNAAGGSLTVYFESPVAGTFNGVLTLTSDTVVRTVRLKAVVSGSAADPTPHFTVADTVFISANLSDFSTDQSVTVPVVGNNFATMIYYAVPDSVNTFTDAYFELDDTDLGRMDRTGGNITVYYYADAAGVYDGRLSMYCYGTKGDESTKVTKNVVLHLVVTNGNANALTDEDAAVKADKMLQNGHIYILRDGVLYDTTGRMIR